MIRVPPPVRAALALLCLAAAACGKADDNEAAPQLPPDQLANTIETLHEARPAEEPQGTPQRMGFLADSEVPPEYRTGKACRLEQKGRLALIAAAPGALARIDGKLVRLPTAGPVGPSGGYWEAPGLTISIGRRAAVAPGAEQANMRWPAGVTIGGDPERPLLKLDADWGCFAAVVDPLTPEPADAAPPRPTP